mgnify:CR=1 FL=1
MTRTLAFAAPLLALCLWAGPAHAHGHGGPVDESAPDAWKHKMCERMTDIALQALRDRDRDRPAKHYEEDGGHGPRIANRIIRGIYAEPQISSPKKAATYGRAVCMEELVGVER